VLAAVGCVAGAVLLGAYADLIRDAGLEIERSEGRVADAASFLRSVRGKLLVARLANDFAGVGVAPALSYEAYRLLDLAEEQVRQGAISYGLIVARKPS